MNMDRNSTTRRDLASAAGSDGGRPTLEQLRQMAWDELRTCHDPEIPVNIVDLGLVYKCELSPLESGGAAVDVELGVTNPGCSMSDLIRDVAREKLRALPGVTSVYVEIALDRPWDPSRLSEAARLQLGLD